MYTSNVIETNYTLAMANEVYTHAEYIASLWEHSRESYPEPT